jgi:hypothetical protein
LLAERTEREKKALAAADASTEHLRLSVIGLIDLTPPEQREQLIEIVREEVRRAPPIRWWSCEGSPIKLRRVG